MQGGMAMISGIIKNKNVKRSNISKRTSLLAVFLMHVLVLLITVTVEGATILSENFDNALSTDHIDGSVPSGWIGWHSSDGCAVSGTISGVTHFSGEITNSGRGDSGKSLKLWRYSDYWPGYCGALYYYFPSSPSYNAIYIRWYMKLSTELDLVGNSYYFKLFRLNISGGTGEIYLNINNPAGFGDMRKNGQVQVLGASWQTVLNNADLRNTWDGNWHCWEMMFGINESRLTLWIDGVDKYSSKSFNYGSSNAGRFTMIQHFPTGNHSSGSRWQSSWQAIEVDDLVIADTPVGP
jgi:hypothetical protein